MKSDLSHWAALDDAAFTLPERPGLLIEPVDLLADPARPRVPEGAIPGFTTLAALVAFSCLVGGPTGGLVVVGVSTLLTASAALVRGPFSLARVGGPRGAGVLLGVAVAALIVGSVTTHDRRPAGTVAGSPVAVDGTRAVESEAAYAALRTPAAPSPTATAGVGPSASVSSAVPAVDEPSATSSSSAIPSARATSVGTASPALPEAAADRATAGPSVPGPSVPGPSVPGLGAMVRASTPAAEALTLSLDALDPSPATVTVTVPAAPRGATSPKASKPFPAGKAPKPTAAKPEAARTKASKPNAAKPKTGKTSPRSSTAVARSAVTETKVGTAASPRTVRELIWSDRPAR